MGEINITEELLLHIIIIQTNTSELYKDLIQSDILIQMQKNLMLI